MPRLFFTGNESNEQAVGARLYNGNVRMYAVRRDNPLDMIFLGGHRPDTFNYNVTEGTMIPEYVVEDGENVVLEVFVSDDKIKSITFDMLLPNKSIPAATRILQTQRSCVWDLLLVPENCEEGCSAFFWLGRNLRFSPFQLTTVPVGYDDTNAPITRTSPTKLTGQLLQYNGLEVTTLESAGSALTSVLITDEGRCGDCNCPYQDIYRAGTAGLIEQTTDGGKNWTALDTTAIANGTEITDLAVINGRVLAAHSDVNNAQGTLGGVAYNVNGVFVEASFTDLTNATTTPDIQQVVPAGGSVVYALGSDGAGAGVIYKSCDSGLNFVEVEQVSVTDPILSGAYDASTNSLWIGVEGTGGVYNWNFTSFVDETANINLGAVDVISMEVSARDTVSVGTSDGQFKEAFAYSSGGGWTDSGQYASPVYSSAGDVLSYRTLVGAGSDVQLRDANTDQTLADLATLSGNVTAISEGHRLLEEGTNFFVAVTDDGTTVIISQCNLCFESC